MKPESLSLLSPQTPWPSQVFFFFFFSSQQHSLHLDTPKKNITSHHRSLMHCDTRALARLQRCLQLAPLLECQSKLGLKRARFAQRRTCAVHQPGVLKRNVLLPVSWLHTCPFLNILIKFCLVTEPTCDEETIGTCAFAGLSMSGVLEMNEREHRTLNDSPTRNRSTDNDL